MHRGSFVVDILSPYMYFKSIFKGLELFGKLIMCSFTEQMSSSSVLFPGSCHPHLSICGDPFAATDNFNAQSTRPPETS